MGRLEEELPCQGTAGRDREDEQQDSRSEQAHPRGHGQRLTLPEGGEQQREEAGGYHRAAKVGHPVGPPGPKSETWQSEERGLHPFSASPSLWCLQVGCGGITSMLASVFSGFLLCVFVSSSLWMI